METEMHQVMQVKQSVLDRKPQYELTLSRANFNHLCAGCPEVDRLVGYADNGLMFCIFEDPQGRMPNAFRRLPTGEGYYAYAGAPVPRLPQGVTNGEFDRLAQQAYDTLEKAINESGRIPIEEETSSGKISLGHVIMKVEKDNSLAPSHN